jgi:hypothetical protein
MSGIKRLETNQSVRGHIGMWTDFLIRQPDLLRKDPLTFEAASGSSFGWVSADERAVRQQHARWRSVTKHD